MGLNIVQKMVQDVLGSINIENRPGEGVTFTMLLPVSLSVMRALIVRMGPSVLAFPLARLGRTYFAEKRNSTC